MHLVLRIGLPTVFLLLTAAPAAAQDDAGTVYLAAGVVLPYQSGPSGVSPQSYSTAAGGLTSAWAIAGGIALGERASFEIELSRTGLMTVRVPSRYGRTYNNERRDRFLALLARLHVPVGRAVRLEPVAGAVITSPDARTQTEFDRGWLTNPGVDVVVEPWQELGLRRHLGLTAGCDLSVGKPGFSFLSTFRLSDTGSYSTRYDDRDRERLPAQHYPGGYPRWTFRAGAGVRVAF
jgi:hypothetical protein